MTLSLCRRPGTSVVVDDDEAYLMTLKVMLPADLNVLMHLSPHAVISLVQQNARLLAEDVAKHQEVVAGDSGRSVVARVLDYWATAHDRYSIIDTVVSDYFMPGMDGLAMLSQLGAWSGMRVLLTGQADEQVAVKAFNAGLINQYISKTSPGLAKVLTESLRAVSRRAHARYEHIWRSCLSPQHYELLQDPELARDLTQFVEGHWVEYIVVGQPLGVLGLSASGVPGWLQLEPASSLQLASEIAEDAGVSANDVSAIRNGKALAAVEIGIRDSAKMVAPAVKFGGAQVVYGALFELWPQLPAGGYSQWKARQAPRAIA